MSQELLEKDFYTLLAEFERIGASLAKDARSMRVRIWDMMERHKVMLGHHLDELREHARGLGITGGNWIDKWLDYWFMPIQMFGEDYRDMFKAHADGMSRKQFIDTPAILWIQEQRRGRAAKTSQPPEVIPSPPTDAMDAKEADRQWKARAEALEDVNRKMKQRLRQLEELVVRYETILRKQQALLARLPAAMAV